MKITYTKEEIEKILLEYADSKTTRTKPVSAEVTKDADGNVVCEVTLQLL